MNIVLRLYRALPLAVFLVVMGVIAYFVARSIWGADRAKVLVMRLFAAVSGILTLIFTLGILYAHTEGNSFAAEVSAGFAVVAAIALGITFMCKHMFIKHHPSYTVPQGFWRWFL